MNLPTPEDRYARARSPVPSVEPGQIWTCPDSEGVLGYRRLRILAPHPDGGWIIEDAPSRMRHRPFGLRRCPEYNLRLVFVLEENPPC